MAKLTKADLLNEREALWILLRKVVHGYDVLTKFSGSQIDLDGTVEDIRALINEMDKASSGDG